MSVEEDDDAPGGQAQTQHHQEGAALQRQGKGATRLES